jgi:hypothetical protein
MTRKGIIENGERKKENEKRERRKGGNATLRFFSGD